MKIVTQLKGGLGNQLFQYAAARTLADISKAELVLDTSSGFARDVDYGRTYALDAFPIAARSATSLERLPFWIDQVTASVQRRAISRIIPRAKGFRLSSIQAEISARCYDARIIGRPVRKNTWLTGYWQSPRYFEALREPLARELTPPPPVSPRALALGQRARQRPSVAVGIRLYEESRTPDVHSRDGKAKSINDINRAVEAMDRAVGSADYHIFCSHRAEALNQLRLPSDPIFVTGNDGYEDPIESLWLLAQCKHHILMNSTFYWWGAWLSENGRPADRHHILGADNFINEDSLPAHWGRF